MATINLTQLTRPAANTNVQFDKPGELNLTAGQARDLLTQIRAQITAGGTVQTGYLSLQRADNGEFTIENRSRFNAFGDKDGAAALVKNLIRIAYGDAIGVQSSAALETAIDAYLSDKSFGKKLGTVSFVRLLNELDVNTGGTATADKKSSFQSLLGTGGSLAVAAAAIAQGAKVTTLLKETGRLMAQDTADSIPAVLAQFTGHGDLATQIMAEHPANSVRKELAGQLNDERSALADKLNQDITARVARLRPANAGSNVSPADLQTQITDLRALKVAVSASAAAPQDPVTAQTRQAIDDALAAAERGLAQVLAGDLPAAVTAKSLTKETLDRMGLQPNNPSAQSTSTFNEHDLPWALRQHETIGQALSTLQGMIDAMPAHSAGQAELQRLHTELSQTRERLGERLHSDIDALVRQCRGTAVREVTAGHSDGVLQAGARLAQMDANLKASGAAGLACIGEARAQAVAQALGEVMSVAVGSLEMGPMHARLGALRDAPQGNPAAQAARAVALNDLLQGMNFLATYLPAGPPADELATLHTQAAWLAHDTLDALRGALALAEGSRASGGAAESARGQAMADLGGQVQRLLKLTQDVPSLSGVRGEVQNLQAALPELTLTEARSLLLNWSSSGSPARQMDPGVQQAIDRSPNKAALDAAIVSLYQKGLFNAGDAFMGRLSGVLAQGDTGSLKWLTELAAGDPVAVNGLLNEPQWDDIALRLKKSAPKAQTPQGLAQVELDHARHTALRTLDSLLRQANAAWGSGGQESFNALNGQGMQSMRLDALSVSALLRAAGVEVGEDLAPRPVAVGNTFEPGRGRTKGSLDNPDGEVTGPLPGADRSFEQARAANVQASGKKAPSLNIESMQLMLASLIAMEAPQGDHLDAGQRVEQERAKALLLKMPFIQASGLTADTPAAEVLAKALEWSSGTQTTPEGLLKAADRIRGASNRLAADAAPLLTGLKKFEQERDPIRAQADEQYLRLKAHLFASNASNDIVRQAEFETSQALFARLARPMQANLDNASRVGDFVAGLQQVRNLSFDAAVDLREVRDMAARVVTETSTAHRRIGAGVVEHYFGVKSSALRAGDGDTQVNIRNNLARLPLAPHLSADPTFGDSTAQRFAGLSEAVGRGASSDAFNAGLPTLDANVAAWRRFVDATVTDNGESRSQHGPYKAPGMAGQMGSVVGGKQTTQARIYLNDLWNDLREQVSAVEKGPQPPSNTAMSELRSRADRYLALVQIGERNSEIQTAIIGLKSGQALRTQAEAAVAQVRDANPEAQRVAMVVVLGLFKTTGLQDLNAFRTELLKPGADWAVSDLEARLSGRFRDMGLQTIAGSPMIAFCKALLLSQENANELLNDRPDGWTGRIKDAVASRLGLSLEPAAPKAVTEMLAREAIATGLNARMAGLLPGQSFELRAAESGEVELTIPTTLPGVDATAGFSMGRDNGVLVRMEADNRYSVVCRYNRQAGASGGISALAGAVKAKVGVGAEVGGGFSIEFSTLGDTQAFVRTLMDSTTPSGSQVQQFMDAAARARVLDSVGGTAGVEASAEADQRLTPEMLGMSLGIQARADASARVSRQQIFERSGVDTVQTTRMSYAWAASAQANVTALRNSDVQSEMLDRRVERLRESGADRLAAEGQDSAAELVRADTPDSQPAAESPSSVSIAARAGVSAKTSREEFDEQRIVTRRGAIHASTSMRRGFRDEPGTVTVTVAGTLYRDPLLQERIKTLLAGTAFERQLTDGSAFASRVQALRSIAGNTRYEIAVSSTLRPELTPRLADLRKQGKTAEVQQMLGDPASYQPATLELTYTQTSQVSSGVGPRELNIPGLEDFAPKVTYRKTALAERSTVVTIDLAAMAGPGALVSELRG